MKKMLFVSGVLLLTACSNDSPSNVEIGEFRNVQAQERTVEVVGSSKMKITADKIQLIVEIREYFEEEFDPNKDYEDYETKVSIEKIEKKLFNRLKKIGIKNSDVSIRHAGNSWRWHRQDLLISKRFIIRQKNLDKLDELLKFSEVRGVNAIYLGKLEHSKTEEYRKQLKKEALKNAKSKAKYLLRELDKDLGEIIKVREVPDNRKNQPYYFYKPQFRSEYANSSLNQSVPSGGESSIELEQLELYFEIEAIFEIK